jgi:glutathione synthase/RimK-type ligase-like ATP-grasp enzyme
MAGRARRPGYDPASVNVAIATVEWLPEEFKDDELLVRALHARSASAAAVPWDDARADWQAFDLVVIRSTWDYARRHDEFLAWVDEIGDRLENAPELVRWNSDKRYLADLAEAGFPVVETTYVGPEAALPSVSGTVVVKPTVSGGGRDTGRFGHGAHASAIDLIRAIGASGRTAMVQPYLQSVGPRARPQSCLSTAVSATGCESALCSHMRVWRRRATIRLALPRRCTTPTS